MKNRPIIFSGPMVRALLAGRKTQTRRLATSPLRRVHVGDRLYVREGWKRAAWCPAEYTELSGSGMAVDVEYLADNEKSTMLDPTFDIEKAHGSGIPSIHMPRWASRLTLIVEGVKVEPLQSISEKDAKAEGLEQECVGGLLPSYRGSSELDWRIWPDDAFHDLWNKLHIRPGETWTDNPEVVALTFRVVHQNIDRMHP